LENAGEWLKSFCETRFDFARWAYQSHGYWKYPMVRRLLN
jgi:hypothetical protein